MEEAIEKKLAVVHSERYAARGVSLDMLRAATESIVHHTSMSASELSDRLDNLVRVSQKTGDTPQNG